MRQCKLLRSLGEMTVCKYSCCRILGYRVVLAISAQSVLLPCIPINIIDAPTKDATPD
jgi:hypothetical protein